MIPNLGSFRGAANPADGPARQRPPIRDLRGGAVVLALLLPLAGCGETGSVDATRLGLSGVSAFVGGSSSGPQPGQEGYVRGFLGGVAVEEPRAAVVARNVLSAGGTAADAAVAAGFTMAVTLPSRAGLGGGGACLVFDPRRGEVESVLFPPGAREAVPAGADRPAATPMLARGLFALHTRGGRRPFEELLVPAEQAARLGVEVSRAFATDLAAVAGPLFADPWSAAAFGGPGGQPLTTGERMVQPDLAATLSTLRTAGVGDLHQGGLARRLEETSVPAGGGLTADELRASVPRVVPPTQLRAGNDTASFLPMDGGVGAAAAFTATNAGAAPAEAAARGAAVAQAFRARGGDAVQLVAASAPLASSGPLPASAGLVVTDRDGMAVSCAFTMNNLFGTGRIAPGTGILLAAAPGLGNVVPPLLSAGLVHNASLRAFRAGTAGSGQEMAPGATGIALAGMLRGQDAPAAVASVPDPGRAVAIGCTRYLPGSSESCSAAADPRGGGLALGAGR
jgi:gamma-glutamyltranspeptidase/glutathione hydrolase